MEIIGSKLATLGILALANTMSAMAQNMSYGADNFYRSDDVTLWPRNFFKPIPHPSSSATLMGAVKEQSANLYVTKLAEQGFEMVSLDLPLWGGSEGEPRNGVAPDLYAEAFSAAVDSLGSQNHTNVDRKRIGVLGICGSGSFVISAAKIDPCIKAIATSSMYNMGAVSCNGQRHSQSPAKIPASLGFALGRPVGFAAFP